MLMLGPPGTGKTLLARALVDLLPAPDLAERIEITRVLSAAGRWPGGLAAERPFRAPHHTVSYAGLVGGGNPPVPGEITLAHRGLLFLDELPEFRREALEALREPLERGEITVARAGARLECPAGFQLVAAMNPAPAVTAGTRGVPAAVRRVRSSVIASASRGPSSIASIWCSNCPRPTSANSPPVRRRRASKGRPWPPAPPRPARVPWPARAVASTRNWNPVNSTGTRPSTPNNSACSNAPAPPAPSPPAPSKVCAASP
jgi:hypothetical protein